MEQPWPPPGPWSLPRAEGEAEEESDLDVSPGSPRYPQLPGGGTQVRRGPCSAGGWRGAVTRPPEPSVSATLFCALFWAPTSPFSRPRLPTPNLGRREPEAIPSLCSIYWGLRRGSGHIAPTFTSTHTFSPWLIPHPWKKFLPSTRLLTVPRFGTAHSITLTLCPLVPALIRALYSFEGTNICAQLMGTVNGCVSIIHWAPDIKIWDPVYFTDFWHLSKFCKPCYWCWRKSRPFAWPFSPYVSDFSFASHDSSVKIYRHTFAFSFRLLPQIPAATSGFQPSLLSSETYPNVIYCHLGFSWSYLRECLGTHITLSRFFS